MLCRMSSIGRSRRSAMRDLAAAHPNPSANRYEITRATTPRESEYSVYQGSAVGRRSICMACTNGASNSRANATTVAITPPTRQRMATSASPKRGGKRSGFMPARTVKLRRDARTDDGNDGRPERRPPLHASGGRGSAGGGAARRPRRAPRLPPAPVRSPHGRRPRPSLLLPAWRREVTASGLARTDPEKYRRIAFVLSVAAYFRDPSRAKTMTPFRVTERTRKAVWESLGQYDLRDRIRQTFPNGTAPRSLLLHGTYDPMPIAAARETAGLLSTGVIELATGHAPHVEATEEFERVLGAFLPRESDSRTVGPSDR